MPDANAPQWKIRLGQTSDFARELVAKWQRCMSSLSSRLDAVVERRRSRSPHWAPLRPLRIVSDGTAGALNRVLDRPAGSTAAAVGAEEPTPMGEEHAWTLATGAIHSAAELAQSAAGLQRTAAIQIDAAAYALDDLMHDLRPVMDYSICHANVIAHQTDFARAAAMSLRAIAAKAAEADHRREKIQHAA